MVHDRGKIKWTSLMLPEHVTMLQNFFMETTPIEKPNMSEDYLLEMDYILQKALQTKQHITLELYQEGYIFQYIGIIDKFKVDQRQLVLQLDKQQEKKIIRLKDIIAAYLSED
ncbi:yOLD protein [Gracilibacillus boraciitolerans JCM 21714]|uniref:YOLD protein n=1 Tax=Gracilibacillus boraciitolerans JCM 21714 TaxID=1298598 RepID=W4VDG7_9BACI|nr:YolD-like family protein [Gracilibacillus boraciitolerans]GAE91425.1 yOLD protein [Gracilibacillus boraciitolerans JCM 21714]